MLLLPKTPVIRDRKYLDWIREQRCVISGQTPCDPAHIRIGGRGGMGMKPSDDRVLPLAPHLHAEQHRIGERTFWLDAMVNVPGLMEEALGALAEKYNRRYRDE